jgi:hypothetical protein
MRLLSCIEPLNSTINEPVDKPTVLIGKIPNISDVVGAFDK